MIFLLAGHRFSMDEKVILKNDAKELSSGRISLGLVEGRDLPPAEP